MPSSYSHLIDLLKPYQQDWVKDDSRFKFGLMARQVGKDFSAGFEGIRQCAGAEAANQKTTWMVAAPSERQSLESLAQWKEWASAFGLGWADYKEERSGPEALLKSATITFPRGSRVIAVPGKPDTVRGFSANVLMTEFAFFENPDATWKALLPSINNPLRGGEKKVRLITTPNGIGNKAHDLWLKNFGLPNPTWSCHKVTIHDAVNAGLPINVEEIREAYDDPEGWAQEYECEFLDVQSTLLPYELIASCESPEATETIAPEFWMSRASGPLFMGIDFGRRRDLTCAWTAELMGDVLHTREVLILEKTSTPDQVEALRHRIARCQRVCMDYTGPGVGMGDYLVKEFGEFDPDKHQFGKIELVVFTNQTKAEIFSKLRMAFEKRLIRVPGTRSCREDFHSVNRVALAGGGITYRAPHTAGGHADRCTGAGLCVRAQSYFSGLVQSTRLSNLLEHAGNLGMGKFSREVTL